MQCHLRIGKPIGARLSRQIAHSCQFVRFQRVLLNCDARYTLNTVICHLLVRDILSRLSRHMAGYTVWILRMMFGDESGIVVADNALSAIKAHALFGRWRAMWIVTGGAGEAIPA